MKFARSLTSKDAYMLVYARCKDSENGDEASGRQILSNELQIPRPPSRALEVVEKMNDDYDEQCEAFSREYAFQYLSMSAFILIR